MMATMNGSLMGDELDNDNGCDVASTTGTCGKRQPPLTIVWRNVVIWAVLHLAALYGIVLLPQAMWYTILWSLFLYYVSSVGVTAGMHRLWAHRSYKAKTPLRVGLAIAGALAFQNSALEWARDHRTHHKFSETDADPHNAKRGFFFSHLGWLMVRKHPDVKEKGKQIDISDLRNDPVVAFQDRHFLALGLVFNVLLPTLVPTLWGESLLISYLVPFVLRYLTQLHCTWLVNSAAHMWGNRPYDTTINPAENWLVSVGAVGEGWHNYHHTFPQDYAASELGWKINLTTMFIDLMALIGQAYDRRKISPDIVHKRKKRTGVLKQT